MTRGNILTYKLVVEIKIKKPISFFMRQRQDYHQQVLVEYRRMNQVATEYERKHVYRIEYRGMNIDYGKAVLLSDRNIQLFSTDLMPNTTGFVHGDYAAASCACRVRDIACLNCGNVVGYHVNVPCKVCLGQPNNGHYWMFRSFEIKAQQIFLQLGTKGTGLPLLWGFVRDSSDFSGGYFRTGDEDAAKLSCQLAVHLASSVPLVVHQPFLQDICAQTFNQDSHPFGR
ncbi:FAM72 protein-domain-containing protein [Gilbertella persicaria]|uniref:FAM72 protein-domain-containing protein n=1 Tax=Gilbertella persicaria TaxID=101096 RepID=UPI00221FD9BB|nr:FAM72 protein-domain-containing protein [Gilbertella persicaria]KAI8092352.1 FAM72 protein-domain-containing protein [Gilbertella persicaria]